MPLFPFASGRLALVVGVLSYTADPGGVLQVLRVTPAGDAAPTATVTVTFDRPVAGSLDRTVDARKIFSITPQVAGVADWRDPVTLRFRPAAPLRPNASYAVTVADKFEAMDGSRLARPYTFTFRVRGPRVLAGWPVGPQRSERFVVPDASFDLVTDAPVDPAAVAASAYLEFGNTCTAPGVVRLRFDGQRPVTDKDPWEFREAGGWDRDRATDPLRRVVRLVPERRLPRGCGGWLVAPAAFDDRGRQEPQRWAFSTYGDFKVVRAGCSWDATFCPTGPVVVYFSTPVRGAEVQRRLALLPKVTFAVPDTADVRAEWVLETQLKPRTGYAVVADPAMTDAFGQRLTGNPVATAVTTGYAPAINYPSGRAVVERNGARTFGLTFVNVDTLEVLIAPVPDSLVPAFMSTGEWRWAELWPALLPRATRQRIAVTGDRDRVRVFGVKLPAPDAVRPGAAWPNAARPDTARLDAARPGAPTLMALQVTSPGLDSADRAHRPIAVVQVTDLGVHARVGTEDGVVWVTGASDGKPRPGAAVTLYDAKGRAVARATTDSAGLARVKRPPAAPADTADENGYSSFEGYVAVTLGTDRAVVGINEYDPDLSPWQFNVSSAWGSTRYPVAAAVFTERGIYRPGEPLYAKAIVRTGQLGALRPPAPRDSLRWLFKDRQGEDGESGTLRDTTVALGEFGTADQRFEVPASASLGEYQMVAQLKRDGRWIDVASTYYRVAEYRPPEFLVDVTIDSRARRTADRAPRPARDSTAAAHERHPATDSAAAAVRPRYAGDSITAAVEARYLFGAPMGRAALRWVLRQQSVDPWELEIPNTDGYYLGETGWWYDEDAPRSPGVQIVASGADTLDPKGRLGLRLKLGNPVRGHPARATVEATITDVNRQSVSASASVLVHPAAFYLGARTEGRAYFWAAGTPVSVGVIAVRPSGGRVAGVKVRGTVVRQEWHQVRRERGGYAELVGEWVSDTVARCDLVTAEEPRPCRFTPPLGGSYVVSFRATDAAGRQVATSFSEWAVGKDWVPWNDESQFKMDVVPDRARYTVGDTATVLFASPFTNAEAWVTVEREGLIEQRRLRITSGTTTLKFPITEALAPNAFVSIIVARGRSAPPGPLDDPGRPTIRVGYAELRVTPERKRLTVAIEPLQKEYRPGDTAQISLRVRDVAGAGERSEVTLWAVDEGVLALTGYRTPDPIDLLYRPRGLGMRLASNLTTVTPQVPEGEKGKRAPGGGGGLDNADILRSRFQATAFFLGSVVTDRSGRAIAAAKLPDNLTTFRVIAVAVTAGDRYGSGTSSLLVTRPLVARPALPRFVRDGDRFAAGVVVNSRLGGTPRVTVTASARGATLEGGKTRSATLEPGRGREVRFEFRTPASTSPTAQFQFAASAGTAADAVEITVPVRPAYHPRAFTVAGVLHDTATAQLVLPADIDPARSRLELSLGTSPLAAIRGIYRRLRVYPYWCTEQVTSAAEPLVALYRARGELGADSSLIANAKAQVEQVVATLSRRQRPDGGIGLWAANDWTTPWISAYAGSVLLQAKAAGIAVSDSVLARLGRYLKSSLHSRALVLAPVALWYADPTVRLSERVMAVDYLTRIGIRDRAAENELLRLAPQLAWEDRVKLAQVFARVGDRDVARRLLEPTWASVKVEGRTATLPVLTRRNFYFYSPIRPAAYLLSATLLVEPSHPLVGPLVETLVAEGRGERWVWNTQDYGTAVTALAEFQRRQRTAVSRGVRVWAGARPVFQMNQLGATARDSSIPLTDLLAPGKDGRVLRLNLEAGAGDAPVFYYLTVTAVPSGAPVRPQDAGIQVERWYERYADGKPVTSVEEGELVRVRLRITVPSERHFVVLDDALPAGLEAVDLSLRTAGGLPGPSAADTTARETGDESQDEREVARWYYGSWDAGWWSPFDHKELRDDRVVYVATQLWKGTYTATYVARATTPGVFTRPPAHAEEMYNPAVHGESDGGVFTVTRKGER